MNVGSAIRLTQLLVGWIAVGRWLPLRNVHAFQQHESFLQRRCRETNGAMTTRGRFALQAQNPIESVVAADDSDGNQHGEEDLTIRRLQERRRQLQQTVLDLDDLESALFQVSSTTTSETSEGDGILRLEDLEQRVAGVEQRVERLVVAPIPPTGLSQQEYMAAIRGFVTLPFRVRWALCESLGLEDSARAACQIKRIPEIVSLLYEQRFTLTPALLEQKMKFVESQQFIGKRGSSVESGQKTYEVKVSTETPKGFTAGFQSMFSSNDDDEEKSDEELRKEAMVERLLGRSTRKEGRVATQEDLNTLLGVLDRSFFAVSASEPIPGGFVIRGTPTQNTTNTELIEKLDKKLPEAWSGQVSFLDDFTYRGEERMFEDEEPILVLLKRDISRGAPAWAFQVVSVVAVLTTFAFSVAVYGGNDAVVQKLNQVDPADADLTTLSWFADRVMEIVLPLAAIATAHEAGHFLIGQRDGIKSSFPTLLPCWGLPFLNCLTSIKEAPKSLASLFDFAAAGPFFGMIVSFSFLFLGMQLTGVADVETAQYFPSVPADLVKTSTLGTAIIDFFTGGDGYVSMQDSKAPIFLHPYAVAGFAGMMMNALELLPIGSTDGGRLALTLFGRRGHTLMSSIMWLVLLVATLSLERADALVGAWVVMNVAQNDPDGPCRDEVSKLDVSRATMALFLWLLAVFVLVPV